MNAVTKTQPAGEVADYGASLMDVIARAASDPSVDIDKMERLIAMQERVQDRAAKAAFTEAKITMRPHLPAIDMRGRIVIKDKNNPNVILQETPFARFEDIQEAVVPILTEFGFDLAFRNGLSEEGKVRVTTILSHRAGHSEETYFDLPHDSSGSKNAVQAVGSSTSYAKRYGVLSILNIRVSGEDDNAHSASEIIVTEVQKQKHRDAPFPQGPARNKQELKTTGRELWRDIEGVEDVASLDDLLAKGGPLIEQMKKALPEWWTGGEKDGNSFEGLQYVIERRRRDCLAADLPEYIQRGADLASAG